MLIIFHIIILHGIDLIWQETAFWLTELRLRGPLQCSYIIIIIIIIGYL